MFNDIISVIPWITQLVMFFLMACLQWRVINALDRALARPSAPVPVIPPVALPIPPTDQPLPTLPKIPPLITKPPTDTPAWFQWAIREIGFHEIGDNQGIERYIGLAHTGALGNPWCAIFTNAALEASGVPGSRSALAQSFCTSPNFIRLSGPTLGAITVFWRGSKSSGLGHVGLYWGEDSDGIWVLGGNENDMVQVEELSKSSASFGLIGYWWPKSVPLPTTGPVIMPSGSPTHIQTPPAAITPSVALGKQVNIVATIFGGQQSAYGGVIHDDQPGVALPYHFPGARPQVRVTGKNGVSIVCDIVDVGPWNINDQYWKTGARPQAESGTDLGQTRKGIRKSNKAGIDLTLAAAKALGIDGKGLVDWEFINVVTVT